MMHRTAKIAAALALCMSAVCVAEDAVIQVTVTATSGRSVFLDRGENDGITHGLIVRLFPPEGSEMELTVRNTTTDAAQAVVLPGVDTPPVGTRGEVVVSENKPDVGGAATTGEAHPPWTRNISIFDESQPLLAPIQRERPEERPVVPPDVSDFRIEPQ